MATRSGKQGLVSYAGQPVDSINSANFDVNIDARDHTSFTTGTVFFRTMLPGLAAGSAAFSGFYDTASTDQATLIADALAGTSKTLKVELDKDTGGNLSSTGFITSLSFAASVDGDSTISVGYTSNGAVTYSTTT